MLYDGSALPLLRNGMLNAHDAPVVEPTKGTAAPKAHSQTKLSLIVLAVRIAMKSAKLHGNAGPIGEGPLSH